MSTYIYTFDSVTPAETHSSTLVRDAGSVADLKAQSLTGAVLYVTGGEFRGVLVKADLGDGSQLYLRWNSRAMGRTILSPVEVRVTGRKFHWDGFKGVKAQVMFLDNDPDDQGPADCFVL